MKPSTPKGTRDFTPSQMRKRDYLFGVLREHFQRFGYAPIETPAMENLTTLTGKYGEEGDQLLFKVLNNGDFLAKADAEALANRDSKGAVASLSKRGLRYDLTVPFARFVVQHQNELSFPFKRYAIQPVWRADRPQKGRYQEFYQCDADVVGSDSLIYEVELVRLMSVVFKALGIGVRININHRGVLEGACIANGAGDYFIEVVTSLDKLHKIGTAKTIEDMCSRGVPRDSAVGLVSLFTKNSVLKDWYDIIEGSEPGRKAIKDIEEFRKAYGLLEEGQSNDELQAFTFDWTLARGLSYYTGFIFEVEVDTEIEGQSSIKMGSIAAGGRYANLTEAFGGRDMSGVGISFGAERIYDVLEEMDAWPDTVRTGRKILLAAMDEENLAWAFAKTDQLRSAGIAADCYPEAGKPKRPMKYADKEQIPFVALIGSNERDTGELSVKELTSGEQGTYSIEALIEKLS